MNRLANRAGQGVDGVPRASGDEPGTRVRLGGRDLLVRFHLREDANGTFHYDLSFDEGAARRENAGPVRDSDLGGPAEDTSTARATGEGPAGPRRGLDEDVADGEPGPFGPILTGFRGDYAGAALELERLGAGEAMAALSHPEVGEIALVWGEPGTNRQDGFGLAKLIAWHPEIVADLPARLAEMKLVSRDAERIELESPRDKAAVRLDWNGETRTWLVTAFEKGKRRAQRRAQALCATSSRPPA